MLNLLKVRFGLRSFQYCFLWPSCRSCKERNMNKMFSLNVILFWTLPCWLCGIWGGWVGGTNLGICHGSLCADFQLLKFLDKEKAMEKISSYDALRHFSQPVIMVRLAVPSQTNSIRRRSSRSCSSPPRRSF